MAVEIERKFLVRDNSWQDAVVSSQKITQRYLSTDPAVRLRITGDGQAFLTIKGKPASGGIDVPEFEYNIPHADAVAMLPLCLAGEIAKTRHRVPVGGKMWEVDVFEGDNRGLIVAEIELADTHETFDLPLWAGDEVTMDKRYKNACLLSAPYAMWPKG